MPSACSLWYVKCSSEDIQTVTCGLPLQVLAAFVNSLDKGSDQKMVSRHREWEKLIQAERLALAKSSSENRGGPAESSGLVRGPPLI